MKFQVISVLYRNIETQDTHNFSLAQFQFDKKKGKSKTVKILQKKDFIC